MRPFAFMARCQETTISQQWAFGVRCFDLRVRFDADGKPYPCHGLIRYDGDVIADLIELNKIARSSHDTFHVRVMLEDNIFTLDIAEQHRYYFDFCKAIDRGDFPHLQFFGGWTKSEWRSATIYDFKKTKEPSIIERHASVSGYGHNLRALWPKLYAKRHNRESFYGSHSADYLMLDFINKI